MEESVLSIKTEQKKACVNCGAELTYNPGSTELKCEYCGHVEIIETSTDKFQELELKPYLAKMGAHKHSEEITMLHCKHCGANQHVEENYKSLHCVYCSQPLIIEDAYTDDWIVPGAILPFQIDRQRSHAIFQKWVKGLWFAPNSLKKAALDAEHTKGLYLPFWTFDAQLYADYKGERGDYYYEVQTYNTVENGRNVQKQRKVQKTKWFPVRGKIHGFVDDTLVKAFKQNKHQVPNEIAHWDLDKLVTFNSKYLAGFVTEKYTIPLKDGNIRSNDEMKRIAKNWSRRDIGGDSQRIHNLHVQLERQTFKHILLPVFISSYIYKNHSYNFFVNGQNGKIGGKRPYSFWKIFLFILLILTIILVFMLVSGGA